VFVLCRENEEKKYKKITKKIIIFKKFNLASHIFCPNFAIAVAIQNVGYLLFLRPLTSKIKVPYVLSFMI